MNFIDVAYAEEEVPTETQPGGVVGSLGINGIQLGIQFINFVFVVAIIWFLILKPLTRKLQERAKLIDESLENAKRIQDNLQRSETEYQRRIDEAKVEANKILNKAAGETEDLTIAMKNKAKSEIELLVDQAKRDIAVEKEGMKLSFKNEAAELVVAALEKFLSEKLSEKKDREMIEEMVKKLQ